jgi:hypothetical protein
MGMMFSSVLGLKTLANGMGQDGMGCMYTRDISWAKKVILMFIIFNISCFYSFHAISKDQTHQSRCSGQDLRS